MGGENPLGARLHSAIPLRKLGSALVVPGNDRDRAACTIPLVVGLLRLMFPDERSMSRPGTCLALRPALRPRLAADSRAGQRRRDLTRSVSSSKQPITRNYDN